MSTNVKLKNETANGTKLPVGSSALLDWNEKVIRAKRDFAIAFTKWVNSHEHKKMKVYIVYEKDGYGGTQVDRVFLNESDARVYVTTEIMVNNSKTPEELAKKQEGQYEMHEVVERL